MDFSDLKSKSLEELRGCLDSYRREWLDLLFEKKCGRSISSARFGVLKKGIARVLMILVSLRKGGSGV